jgi:hypothetical protein
VRASDEAIRYYKDRIASGSDDIIHHPGLRRELQTSIDEARLALHACTHPVAEPNDDTVREVIALRRLTDAQCRSAPHLLRFIETGVPHGLHEYGIVGGYVVMTLMTKMPGAALPYSTFCKMSREQRDEVREAFRSALL